MKVKTLFRLSLLSLFFILPPLILNAQNAETNEYNAALQSYVQQLLGNISKDAISRERFLVQQIRLINEEIRARVTGIDDIRRSYFERLHDRLTEIRSLRSRLAKDTALNVFIKDLEKNIKETIDARIIDYKRQRVIEDAIQLLYIAEEMLKLDPNASVESDPEFSQDLNKTKTNVKQTFGEETLMNQYLSKTVPESAATIYNVYEEWKKTERLKFQLRWTDVLILKNRMIKNGSAIERDRMFKRELRHAAEMFNFGFYDLSVRSFDEIITRYSFVGRLDDCLYYKGEANYLLARYQHADEDFSKFIREYPTSPFMSQVYTRLIRIAYHFKRYDQVMDYLTKIRATLSVSENEFNEFLLIASISALKANQHEAAVGYALEIPATSMFFAQAHFILAEAYAGAGNLPEAEKALKVLLEMQDLQPDFHFTVLLKLGYLCYETGDYIGAINYFNRISGAYKQFDRVLIGYSWSHYKIEINKPIHEEKDFSYARKYLELLVDSFMGSDYNLEGRTLLGYIYQLEAKAEKALDHFEYAFASKEAKLLSDRLNEERESMNALMSSAKRLEQKALETDNPTAFQRARAMQNRLQEPLIKLSYLDLSSTGVAARNEIDRLNNQIIELDRLKQLAREKGRTDLIKRIEEMQLRIYATVNSMPIRNQSPLGINYFDDQPLARKTSMVEHENDKLGIMRTDLKSQREKITQQLARLDVNIQDAKSRKAYHEIVTMELTRDRFKELLNQLDFLETRSYAFAEKSDNIDLNRWSDFGAFGMTNVRFAIKNMKASEIAYMQEQINEINNFLENRKSNIEYKIAQINNEITLMTRRVREQERYREREELNRQFEKSYFDTHDTELNYNTETTQPPKIQDEPK